MSFALSLDAVNREIATPRTSIQFVKYDIREENSFKGQSYETRLGEAYDGKESEYFVQILILCKRT